MKTNKPILGLDAEQTEKVAWAVDKIVNAVYADLQEACGQHLTNEGLMSTVADHLHDWFELYDQDVRGPRELDRATHEAWLKVAPRRRWAWLIENFDYV